FFIFSLCGKRFAIGFKDVAAIKSKYFSSILFKMPEHLAGIFSFQGEILSILRLEKIIGLEGAADGRVLMIIGKKDLKLGLFIDSVDSVCSLKPPVSFIKPGKAKSGPKLDLDHIGGILPFENNDILHLDVESLFESKLIWI
ncbi:MAG: chemotaxis protein CheW, partial [Nitrospinota bacterium]